MAEADTPPPLRASVGDWIEERDPRRGTTRRGQIVDVLGGPGREHFQVRWDEEHESMVFPGEAVRIVRAG